MLMTDEHQQKKAVSFFLDVVIFLSLVENVKSMGFGTNMVNSSGIKVKLFEIKDIQNNSLLEKLLRMKQENFVETVINEPIIIISANVLTQSNARNNNKVIQKRSASKNNETLFFDKSITKIDSSVHPIIKTEKSPELRLRNLRKVKNKIRDVEITVKLVNWDGDANVTSQLLEELNNRSVSENISIDYVASGDSVANISYVFSDIFNSTLIESKNKTKADKDVGKSNYTLYELQMIKVGVLCGVLTLLLLSTCRMLLKVLARHVDREKTYTY